MIGRCFSGPNHRFLTWRSHISCLPQRHQEKNRRDERLRIQTLYFDAGWTQEAIALQLNLSLGQIKYALSHRITPQKHCTGRKIRLNTPQRKRLIEWVTASKANRRVPWPEIPLILGLDYGEYAIRTAFKKEGYTRRSTCQKPPLSKDNRKARLA